MSNTKIGYVVWSNTDLTEGRGYEFPLYVCETYTTAVRLGARKYVQGSDCRVTQVDLFVHKGLVYGPVDINHPTMADRDAEKIRQAKIEKDAARAALIAKLREQGISEDDLKLLAE